MNALFLNQMDERVPFCLVVMDTGLMKCVRKCHARAKTYYAFLISKAYAWWQRARRFFSYVYGYRLWLHALATVCQFDIDPLLRTVFLRNGVMRINDT